MNVLGVISKGAAFLIVVACVMAVFLVSSAMVFFDKADDLPVAATLTALVGIGTTYIGLQVANNGVRGKYFEPELQRIDEKAKEGEK